MMIFLSLTTRMSLKDKNSHAANLRLESTGFKLGYAMGGMTIGFQDASTDNKSWATGSDDTRTVSVKVAF